MGKDGGDSRAISYCPHVAGEIGRFSVVKARAKTSGKHVPAMYTPLNPILYSKTGVSRGIPIFLIFALKHRLWVLVRTASARRF